MSNENLALIVLTTGENLMGTINETTEDGIVVSDIVAFAPKPDGSGVMTIPYLQFSVEDTATFNNDNVRHILTPNQDLADYHTKQFSKIIVPDSKLMKPKMMGVD